MNKKYLTTEAYIYAYLQEEMNEEEKSIFIKDIQLDKSMYEEYIEIRVRYYLLLLRKEEVGILSLLETTILQKEKLFFQKSLSTNDELQEEYTIQLGQHKAILAQKLKTSYVQNSPYIKEIISNIPQEEIEAAMKPSWYRMLFPYRYILLLLFIPFIYWLSQTNFNTPITISQDSTKTSQTTPIEQLSSSESPKIPTKVNNDSLEISHDGTKEQLKPSGNTKTSTKVNKDSLKRFQELAKEKIGAGKIPITTTDANALTNEKYADRLDGKGSDEVSNLYTKKLSLVHYICGVKLQILDLYKKDKSPKYASSAEFPEVNCDKGLEKTSNELAKWFDSSIVNKAINKKGKIDSLTAEIVKLDSVKARIIRKFNYLKNNK